MKNVIIYVEGDDCMVMKEGTKTIIFRVDSSPINLYTMQKYACKQLDNKYNKNY